MTIIRSKQVTSSLAEADPIDENLPRCGRISSNSRPIFANPERYSAMLDCWACEQLLALLGESEI